MSPKLRSLVRSLIPRWFLCGLRAAVILVAKRGQARTDAAGLIVDGAGRHQPWLTYPAIDFLGTLEWNGRDVYEFGSGSSTLYWLDQGATVASVEHDREWLEKMQRALGTRASLRFRPKDATYARSLRENGRRYDLILIDGAVRFNCAQESVSALKPGGIIVFDNTDWYPAACHWLRQQGFTQLDFEGFTPITSFPSVTSVFFRGEIGIPYREKPAGWVPTGANPLPVVDDDHLL